ncbi:serine protein kinase RIO [Sciscionella sediminilitoris]|uniref:serine protein kinase RIO n=1 Tax=Sciscionella sediminilitoris TaxID=1445613 RepID=UPI0004DF8D88|nr:RIO1 family regulatory kinase/ATPase [Sciscionella sp. SE31]
MRYSTDPADYEDYEDFTEREPRRARRRRFDDEPRPIRSGRLTEEAKALLENSKDDGPAEEDERYSSYPDAVPGPGPLPGWVLTEAAATDTELGVLKTGKEADVHLIRRALPGNERTSLLAAKRYRPPEHRQFHRDAGYLEGRRMRKSRELRAVQNRTAFGRNLIAEQWTIAEFAALSRLWQLGAPVPYPVQRHGTELLLEYLGDESGAAPRLAELRPDPGELDRLWAQLIEALTLLAEAGLTHGDLSPYNVLVHEGRPMLIDLPQVVELVVNPNGPAILERDVTNLARWFTARGRHVDIEQTTARLRAAAGMD